MVGSEVAPGDGGGEGVCHPENPDPTVAVLGALAGHPVLSPVGPSQTEVTATLASRTGFLRAKPWKGDQGELECW